MKTDPVYIIGHKHPDTDSVASAIGYAFFKKAMGVKAIPCRLGDINSETEYLLNRFGFEVPMLLHDARNTIGDIEIDPPVSIGPESTIAEVILLMNQHNVPSFAVTDEDGHIIGFISKSDLANIGLGDTAEGIELLKHAIPADIAKTLDGQLIYDDPELHLSGKTSIIALTAKGTENYDVKDRIVIVGDSPEAMLELIENGAGMVIAVWTKEIAMEVIAAAKERHCPVIISGHGTMNTSRYLFFTPRISLIMKSPILFKRTDLCEDAAVRMAHSRFRNYPVADEEGRLVGYVGRYHLMNSKNKSIIMVDHNEFSQSVRAIEKAQILEVVDHHRINDFATGQPVAFRNEIGGSSATIIATMFCENQVLLSKNLAGLLLGAVLSDTLMFRSPTTTEKDRKIANVLAALADLDIEEFGAEMFAATAVNSRGDVFDMIVRDIKYYEIDGCKTMISQVIIDSALSMNTRRIEIMHAMDSLVQKKELDLLVVAFTSIIEDGSLVFASGEKANRCMEAFPTTPENGPLQKGLLSRKKQILPAVTAALE